MRLKVTFDLDEEDIVTLLARCAVLYDEALPNRNLDKPEIRKICAEMLTAHGTAGLEDWSEEVEELKAAVINGWANAQVRKYNW